MRNKKSGHFNLKSQHKDTLGFNLPVVLKKHITNILAIGLPLILSF